MATERLCDNVLVGVCGSIHAVHIHAYLIRLRESLAGSIKVIMTDSARRMVDPKTVELYTDDRVFIDLWDQSPAVDRVPHIQLTSWADLFVVVPATADIMGKAANGVADDLLSTAILSFSKPIVFAPAMNQAMWENSAVQRNVRVLKQDGHYIVPPESGLSVASGEWDQALAPSPDTLMSHLQHVRMKELKREYWGEATREKPLTPAQKRLQAIAVAAERQAPVED